MQEGGGAPPRDKDIKSTFPAARPGYGFVTFKRTNIFSPGMTGTLKMC